MAVEFCTNCKESLPKGDMSFKAGKGYTSHDYICPSCGKLANPSKESVAAQPDPESDRDLVIREGDARIE